MELIFVHEINIPQFWYSHYYICIVKISNFIRKGDNYTYTYLYSYLKMDRYSNLKI